jgi:hypothetical protein
MDRDFGDFDPDDVGDFGDFADYEPDEDDAEYVRASSAGDFEPDAYGWELVRPVRTPARPPFVSRLPRRSRSRNSHVGRRGHRRPVARSGARSGDDDPGGDGPGEPPRPILCERVGGRA